MVIYRSPEDAIRSAIAMQQRCQRHSATHSPEDQVLLCIGIGFGQVLRIGDDDIYGAEVNAACKLGEDSARADEILMTGAVAKAITLPEGCKLEPLADAPPGAEQAFRLLYR
jgi:hypothetical protein